MKASILGYSIGVWMGRGSRGYREYLVDKVACVVRVGRWEVLCTLALRFTLDFVGNSFLLVRHDDLSWAIKA